MVFSGGNPVLTDALALKAMGLDWRNVPTIARAREIGKWPLLPEEKCDLDFPGINVPDFHFKMPKGWR
jgi:hypothetical protein